MTSTGHEMQGGEACSDPYVAPDLKIQFIQPSSNKERTDRAQLKSTLRTMGLFSGASTFS